MIAAKIQEKERRISSNWVVVMLGAIELGKQRVRWSDFGKVLRKLKEQGVVAPATAKRWWWATGKELEVIKLRGKEEPEVPQDDKKKKTGRPTRRRGEGLVGDEKTVRDRTVTFEQGVADEEFVLVYSRTYLEEASFDAVD